MRSVAVMAVGGGLSAVALALLGGQRLAESFKVSVEQAVTTGGTFDAKLTGYWPFAAASAAEKKMEGAPVDRKGKPLHTLEQHLADPVAHPYVSVAGDPSIFPYGQRITLAAWPKVIFRVVDTGGHFKGTGKLYRVMGREPLDVCVQSSKSVVPSSAQARIIFGDHFDKAGKAVALNEFKGQTVTMAGDFAFGDGLGCLGCV